MKPVEPIPQMKAKDILLTEDGTRYIVLRPLSINMRVRKEGTADDILVYYKDDSRGRYYSNHKQKLILKEMV